MNEVNKQDVIKGLECCSEYVSSELFDVFKEKCMKECPYYDHTYRSNCLNNLIKDAMLIIKNL